MLFFLKKTTNRNGIVSTVYIPNRVKSIMDEKGINNKTLAELTGYTASKVSRIVNQNTNMDGHDFLNVAKALDVHPGDLFVTSHGQIETNLSPKHKLKQQVRQAKRKRYEFWLSAEGQNASWFVYGIQSWSQLKHAELAEEFPSYARMKLFPGRVLMGRAVEESGRYGDIPATQRLSLARSMDTHPDDLSVSRFQCDFTVPTYNDTVGLYARGPGLQVNGYELQQGESIFLEHRDKVIFPNDITLHLEREESSS